MFNDLVTILTDTPRKKYVAYHRFISCVLERLLNTDYTQDAALGPTPSILSKMNFHQNPSKVKPIRLTAYMHDVIRHESLVSPTPSLENIEKKKKSWTVSKPKSKSPGPQASGTPPKETKGKKKSKTKNFSLIQTKLQLTKEKEPSEGTDTSQSVSTGHVPAPQDTDRSKQLVVTKLPFTCPDEGICTSKLLHEGTSTDPKDT
ncbi:hypothetical protein Tco_0759346 [Tanacetum coccineum]